MRRDDHLFENLANIARSQQVPMPRSVRVLYPGATKIPATIRDLESWARQHRFVIEQFAKFLTHQENLTILDQDLGLWVIECDFLRDQALRDGVDVP